MSPRTITLANTTIHYWTYHDEAPRTMILIHGFTGSHDGFQYLEPLLDDTHLIIPDLPGFGVSDLPPHEDWSIDRLAALTNEFVAALKLKKPPIILGHSMGGLIASSMVDQQPELYDEKVILISPVPTAVRGIDARQPGKILGNIQYSVGSRSKRVLHSRLTSRITTNLIITTRDKQLRRSIYQHHYDNLDHISSGAYYRAIYRDINNRGAIDHSHALHTKRVLLIASKHDRAIPLTHVRTLAQAIEPERFIVLPHAGHLTHYETPHELTREITSFIC